MNCSNFEIKCMVDCKGLYRLARSGNLSTLDVDIVTIEVGRLTLLTFLG